MKSLKQWASIGAALLATPLLLAGPASAATPAAESSTGCAGPTWMDSSVCLTIVGKGTYVSAVSISNNTNGSGIGRVYVNGEERWNLGNIRDNWRVRAEVRERLKDGDWVCAEIEGVVGRPCNKIIG